jgi:hypothetical protein
MTAGDKVRLAVFVVAILLVVAFVPFPWTGHLPYRYIDTLKNKMYKWRHLLFRVPLNRTVCADNLNSFADVMGACGLVFWLSEGTALGARRDGDFILHDDDLDIGVWATG